MRLKEIHIQNYKSLRDVRFTPGPLSVMVGPNASGKSNFIDAIDFLSDVYSSGLEVAIQRKGGYENIAHRKQRRTKSSLFFGVRLEKEFVQDSGPPELLRIRHQFSFRASGTSVRSEFVIEDELFECFAGDTVDPFFRFERTLGSPPQFEIANTQDTYFFFDSPAGQMAYFDYLKSLSGTFAPGEQELIGTSSGLLFVDQLAYISQWKIFQISPALTRLSAAPTPNPTLSRQGENLPAMIDWLQLKHPNAWAQVLAAMQEVVPDLEDISTDYTHTKTLGLHFKEKNVGRPFTPEDISAGTLHTLAVLVAVADPRITLLCIDELENSLHPWIISVLIRRFRELSGEKNIFLTTHSPTLIDALHSEEIWVVHKKEGETHIEQLTELHPEVKQQFLEGETRLSEYLGSGLVPEVVPGGVY